MYTFFASAGQPVVLASCHTLVFYSLQNSVCLLNSLLRHHCHITERGMHSTHSFRVQVLMAPSYEYSQIRTDEHAEPLGQTVKMACRDNQSGWHGNMTF